MLYEEWLNLKGNEDLPFSVLSELNEMHKSINEAWVQTGKPWLNTLSESVMAFFSMEDFRNEVLPHLNESYDYTSIKESYAIYELALLQTHRPDWFLNEDRIMVLPNYDEHKVILSKNESFFIISMSTWSAINEDWFDDAVNKGKELAGSAWDTLKSGAQKVWGFISKVASTSWDYMKENPFEAAAIAINIFGGIMAFVPAAGQVVAPLCAILAGGAECIQGGIKMKKAGGYLSQITDPIAKTLANATEGIPYLVAGGISMFLGFNGMLTAIADAAPGVLGFKESTKQAAKKAADSLSKNIVAKVEHGLEHAIADFAKNHVKDALVKSVKLASKNATALFCIVLVKALKGCLGPIAEKIIQGVGKVGEAFEFLLDLPKKITSMIEDMKTDSYAGKLIQGALKKVVKPFTAWASTFVEKYVKPYTEPITSYLKILPDIFKEALESIRKHKVDVDAEEIDIKHNKVEQEDIKMSTEEKEQIKSLEKGEGKKAGGSSDAFEKDLKDADPNFKGIKGNPKKLTVEFEGWGDKKKDAWKKEMSMEELVKNMKSKDWSKIRFEYGGDYPTDLHKGGAYARLKAIKESAILPFNEWISR